MKNKKRFLINCIYRPIFATLMTVSLIFSSKCNILIALSFGLALGIATGISLYIEGKKVI